MIRRAVYNPTTAAGVSKAAGAYDLLTAKHCIAQTIPGSKQAFVVYEVKIELNRSF